MSFASRVLGAIPYEPYKATKPKWQKKARQNSKGRPANKPAPPPGTYTKSPGDIAHNLKNNSRDFKQAVNRLTFYKNASGDNLDSVDKERLNRAKENLYRAYDRELPDQG